MNQKISKIISALVVIAILPIGYIFADEEHSIDKFIEKCIEKDSTTVGMNYCVAEGCQMWNQEMNKNYKLLMSILSKEEQQKLKESQTAWLKFRDLETKFRVDTFCNLQGTMYRNMAMAEKLDIIKQRALEFKQLYETLKYIKD